MKPSLKDLLKPKKAPPQKEMNKSWAFWVGQFLLKDVNFNI